jgi:hypothetical protein
VVLKGDVRLPNHLIGGENFSTLPINQLRQVANAMDESRLGVARYQPDEH